MLVGRSAQQADIDRLLDRARGGHSGVLVLRGEAGIGKTALLDYAAQAGSDLRTLHSTGVESEAELPYAALHALLRPLVAHIDTLPKVQAKALRGAFGMATPEAADRFLIGNGVLALLAHAAQDGPMLCVVDDMQWFDQSSADALLFAARRTHAEGIAIILAVREGHAPSTQGLPEKEIAGLEADAAMMLLTTYGGRLSPADRGRVISGAQGNPLALREMATALTVGRRPDVSLHPSDQAPMPITDRIEAIFADRIRTLPERTRTALLVAAAAGTSELGVVSRATELRGSSILDLAAAESERLVYVTSAGVLFRHPLVRSAVYQDAPAGSRLAVHRALAEALAGRGDNDRRAWHLAASTTEPDEHIARELERAAEHARRSGGYAAVTAAYERAAELTPEPALRAARLAKAARAAFVAGNRNLAGALAERVDLFQLDSSARAYLLDLESALIWHRDQTTAISMTLEAATAVADESPDTAARLFFESMVPDWATGDAVSTLDIAVRMEALKLRWTAEGRPFAQVVSALGKYAAGQVVASVAELRELTDWLHNADADLPPDDRVLDRIFRPYLALLLGDLQRAHQSASALLNTCRTRGAVEALPFALTTLAQAQALTGRHQDARSSAMEALRWSEDLGHQLDTARIKALLLYLAATAGDSERCQVLAREVSSSGSASIRAIAGYLRGIFELGQGKHEQALRDLAPVASGPAQHVLPVLLGLPNLVEAAAFLGEPEQGSAACDRYSAWAEATGQDWCISVSTRCRALLAEEGAAGPLYRQAVQLPDAGRNPFELARTELLYGSWLRRHRQVREARRMLRSAMAEFDRLGAEPWAQHARNELRATGERLTEQPKASLLDRLTPQELEVVRLAIRGLSNKEIATQMFLSPRTVAFHLYKAFPKLGVASRHELAQLKPE